MKRLMVLALALASTPALAQGVPVYNGSDGYAREAQGVFQTGVVAATDYSQAAVTAATTYMPAISAGRYFSVQNHSTTAYCYFRVGAAANIGQPSTMVPPLGYYETPSFYHPTGAVSFICGTSAALTIIGYGG